MATQTVETSGGVSLVPIVTESRTYSLVSTETPVKDKDGNAGVEVNYKVMSEDDAKAFVEKEENKKANASIVFTQTFAFDHANTIEAAQELFGGNEKELCKQLNNAVDVKLGNRVRSIMQATDDEGNLTFEPQEGNYSLRQYIGEETTSRGKSTLEKLMALIEKLPPDQKKQFLASYQASE